MPRLAAQEQTAVSDVVTIGTPLGPVSVTALSAQPVGDAWRLLRSLLPPRVGTSATGTIPEDPDLTRGRGLVAALDALSTRADPTSELRPPATAPAAPRDGLTITAVFGVLDADQVGRAITAVVAAGLAARARAR